MSWQGLSPVPWATEGVQGAPGTSGLPHPSVHGWMGRLLHSPERPHLSGGIPEMGSCAGFPPREMLGPDVSGCWGSMFRERV